MREAAENEAWQRLNRDRASLTKLDRVVDIEDGERLDLDRRCIVLAGLNGAGKSRCLRAVADNLGPDGVLLRLHQVCEQVRLALASRSDVDEIAEEVGPLPLDSRFVEQLSRVVGRDYTSVEWFGLELQSTDGQSLGWRVPDGSYLVPFFRVIEGGLTYSSLDMGLGELSIHLLFWALWYLQSSPGTVILLDEPDAYLPPRTRLRLLSVLLDMTLRADWQVVLTSHSEEIIASAYDNDSLLVLSRRSGVSRVYRSSEHGGLVLRDIVSKKPTDTIVFCEDESAAALIRVLIRDFSPSLADVAAVIWKDGDGYLRKLAQHLPRTSASPLCFGLVFDGDIRSTGVVAPVGQTVGPFCIFLPNSRRTCSLRA